MQRLAAADINALFKTCLCLSGPMERDPTEKTGVQVRKFLRRVFAGVSRRRAGRSQWNRCTSAILIASSTNSDSVTAAVTPPTPASGECVDAEAECGHRHHRQERRRPRDWPRRHRAPAARTEALQARNPMMNHGTSVNGLMAFIVSPPARRRDIRIERPTTTGPSISTRNQFDQRSDLGAHQTGGQCRREHLGHGIDRKAGENPVLRRRQPQQRNQQRQTQHHQHAENGGKGDRGRDVVAVGADDGRHSRDRGISADRIAAGDQDREPGRQTEHSTEAVARGQRHDDCRGDRSHQQRAGGGDRRKTDRRAEQHHGKFEQLLGAERNAARPALGRIPDGADGGAEQDRDDERLE